MYTASDFQNYLDKTVEFRTPWGLHRGTVKDVNTHAVLMEMPEEYINASFADALGLDIVHAGFFDGFNGCHGFEMAAFRAGNRSCSRAAGSHSYSACLLSFAHGFGVGKHYLQRGCHPVVNGACHTTARMLHHSGPHPKAPTEALGAFSSTARKKVLVTCIPTSSARAP
jgi:hypothetical protein